MEIQLDTSDDLSLQVATFPDSILETTSLNDEMISSSSGSGWRRLRRESICLQPNIDSLWLKGGRAKVTDIDRDLDDEIYEKIKSEQACILNLKDRPITNEEIDALSPIIQKIIDLVTPGDGDTKAANKEKIDLLQQLVNHGVAQDSAAKKLLEKDIKELKDANNMLVCAKGKHKGGLGHKVAKFWKKHKKVIIVTAAVVAVAAAVVVVAVAASSAAAAGAAAAGGAGATAGGVASGQGSKKKPHPKPDLDPSANLGSSTDTPTVSYPFQTFNPYPVPEAIVFGESGVHYDGQFVSSYEDMLLHPFGNSWVNNWLSSAERLRTEAFPQPHIRMPQIQPTASRGNASNSNTAYQARGDWALTNGYSDQALQDFNTAIEMEPSNPDSYLGRGSAHFELGQYDTCVVDYNQYTTLTPKEFSVKDFSIGFAKGLPKGVYDSGEGLLLFLSDLVKHPINTSSQVYESFSALSGLVRAGEWEMIGSSLSPEVHELITQWETLPDSRKGELAGYAFGKHGADILIPGAAAKIAARGAGAVKEVGAICKNLRTAEKVFVLEAVASASNAGIDVGAVITSAERTLVAGEDLGLSAKEMAELKQAGNLEQVVGKGRDYFAGQPEKQAWFDKFERVKTGLKPHINTPMPEEQIRNLIHQYDIPTLARPAGIAENFLVTLSDKGVGIKYVDPLNQGTYVRVMSGTPYSPWPHQQKPYVSHVKNGEYLDKHGNRFDANGKKFTRESPEVHIPYDEFVYRE